MTCIRSTLKGLLEHSSFKRDRLQDAADLGSPPWVPLQAQREALTSKLELACQAKDEAFAEMKRAKEKEVVAHLQAAKWEAMQLDETRNLLGLAYHARGLHSLSMM